MKVVMLASSKKRHVIDWANYLADQGVELHIISDSKQPEVEYDERIQFHHPHWSFLQNVVTYKLRPHIYANNRDKWKVYLPIIKGLRPQLIHAQEALGYGPILKYLKDYPTVLTPWGSDVFRIKEDLKSLRSELVIQGAQAATIISTNACELEEQWSNILNVPKEKFLFFSWGIDVEKFRTVDSEQKKELRSKWNLPTESRVVFNSRLPQSNYRPEKVIEMWEKGRNENSFLILITAGVRYPEEWKKSNAQNLLILDRKLTPSEMAELYQLSDFTMNLPVTDLLAQSLLEGMACGCIPINCRNTAYQHLIHEDGGVGVWVDPDDVEIFRQQVDDALAMPDDELEAAQNRNGKYLAKSFRQNDCRKKMLDVYERAIANHSST